MQAETKVKHKEGKGQTQRKHKQHKGQTIVRDCHSAPCTQNATQEVHRIVGGGRVVEIDTVFGRQEIDIVEKDVGGEGSSEEVANIKERPPVERLVVVPLVHRNHPAFSSVS